MMKQPLKQGFIQLPGRAYKKSKCLFPLLTLMAICYNSTFPHFHFSKMLL